MWKPERKTAQLADIRLGDEARAVLEKQPVQEIETQISYFIPLGNR
ncbi:MAG: hypothetical protein R3B47_01895 [Bacteroidia bacterium]